MGKEYTAVQAARLSGISILTMRRYLRDGKIKPKSIPMYSDGRVVWRFTDSDIEKVKRLHAASKPGRKPKAKK